MDRFRLLGELRIAGTPDPPPCGPKPQILLASLLMDAGTVVSDRRLAEAVWGDEPPGDVPEILYSHVSRLRGLLRGVPRPGPGSGPVTVARRTGGYVVTLDRSAVDVHEFRRLVVAARGAGDVRARYQVLDGAIAMCDGVPLAGLPGRWAADLRRTLVQEHLDACIAWADLAVDLGHAAEVVTRLTALRRAHPLVEPLTGALMRALAATGRVPEALNCFEETRVRLAEDLGVDPGARLRELHGSLLRMTSEAVREPVRPKTTRPGERPGGAVPAQLPIGPRVFSGRTAELALLDDLLPGHGDGGAVLCVVTGTAGVGKTALVVHWAHRAAGAGEFPDGQLFVDLRGFDPAHPVDPGEVLEGFLRAMGIRHQDIPSGAADRAARYRTEIARRRMLVVLDNASSEEQVRPLLPGSGPSTVLVTSRETLTGLVVREGADRVNLRLMSAAESMVLLRSLLGRRVDEDPAQADALAVHCARLPLALRVAAELARAREDRSLADLVAELRDEHDRLNVLGRYVEDRTAVRAVLSWSYRNLAPHVARMFRLLGLHPGPDLDVHGAAALAGVHPTRADQALRALTEAHLVQPTGSGRFGMHDLLRAYAGELVVLQESGQERDAALDRLLDVSVAMADAAAAVLHGSGQLRRLPGLDLATPSGPQASPQPPAPGRADQPSSPWHPENRDEALAWFDAGLPASVGLVGLASRRGRAVHVVRLVMAMSRYLEGGGHLADALKLYDLGVRAAGDLGHLPAQAHGLVDLALIHQQYGHYDTAEDCLRRAEDLGAEAADPWSRARAAGNLGTLQALTGHPEEGIASLRRSLDLNRAAGSRDGEVVALNNIGHIYERIGDLDRSYAHLREAIDLCREVGNPSSLGILLGSLGMVQMRRGEYASAVAHHREALDLVRGAGHRTHEGKVLNSLGRVHQTAGDVTAAETCYRQALDLALDLANTELEVSARTSLGSVLMAAGRVGDAVDQLTSVLALSSGGGDVLARLKASVLLAGARRRGGQYELAATGLRGAMDLAERTGHREVLATASNDLGELLVERAGGVPAVGGAQAVGRGAVVAEAVDLFTRALDLARSIGDRAEEERAVAGLVTCRSLS
ncbi:MAG: tetratricopeptide repeat protein [Actinomycetales bacterium]|nr:tetratricopeptide repeat protein [Actinomycetales bacterium]